MNIEFLKTGKYCIHSAFGPIVECEEGAQTELPEDQAAILIGAGWAKLIDGVEKVEIETSADEVEPDEATELGTEDQLNELIDGVEDEAEQKALIQDWAIVNANLKVSKSKSVVNMVSEILTHMED